MFSDIQRDWRILSLVNTKLGEQNVKPRFQGAYGIILTPFQSDGKVDYVELEKQLEVVCNSGIQGVVVCGSTGEFTYMSREETREIMAFSKKIESRALAGSQAYALRD